MRLGSYLSAVILQISAFQGLSREDKEIIILNTFIVKTYTDYKSEALSLSEND